MFRNLLMLRNRVALQRCLVSRLCSRSNMSTGLMYRCSNSPKSMGNVLVSDINVNELAKGDMEFTRNFLNALTALDCAEFADAPDKTEDSPVSDESPSLGTEGTLQSGAESSILGVDGNPIVPIEIDGWNQDDEDDPTVQKNGKDIDIGNDDEYKAEMALRIPEIREAQSEYKGIKVKLPEAASQDIGTYRFRRDAEDLQGLGDDTRLVRFDKK
ncbi:hypothetical protein KR009_005879 [Drosophila setifemur]|nr:hypothetical protein KR009_005879 [Drosophila setifemur]